MVTGRNRWGTGIVLTAAALTLHGEVPQLINYQGRVAVSGTNFSGPGQFKFALVNGSGSTSYWSNNGTSSGGSEPTAAVTLQVTHGLYSVLLGDTELANMSVIPPTVFTNADVRLRVWFNDGANGSQLMVPDQRIAAVGYAIMAGNVPDGAITGAKIAGGAVGTAQLAAGAAAANISPGSLTASQLAPGAAAANLAASGVTVEATGGMVVTTDPPAKHLLEAGYVKVGQTDWTVSDRWRNAAAQHPPPSGRYQHTAVWTGKEMLVWGGFNGQTNLGDGGRYNSPTSSWSSLSSLFAPAGRTGHTAIWTGTEMIVWGGYTNGFFNDGGRYDPVTNGWTLVTTIGAPAGRSEHTAVWTGTEMIVWGGADSAALHTGGRYNPLSNSWAPVSLDGVPAARRDHTAVWTGSEMIVWGGTTGGLSFVNSGGRYNPVADTWSALPTAGAPSARRAHTAVWTQTEMIVWGGSQGGVVNTGARYNPATNAWTAVAAAGAPSARSFHTAIWTGSEMIIWAGEGQNALSLNDGGRYRPATDAWLPVAGGAPAARSEHTAVWTGTVMIVWGGYNGAHLNTGARYSPESDGWTDLSVGGDFPPEARYAHSAVWTGVEMIVYGGFNGTASLGDGARYNAATHQWTTLPTVNSPGERNSHTAVWTGAEMIVYGGYHTTELNSGARFSPATGAWSAMAPDVARSSHTAVWTGTHMICFGGNSSPITSGRRYNPASNLWVPAASTNQPAARHSHTATWTGTEMIVWGGIGDGNLALGSGGRYNAATDTWAVTSTSGAPTARSSHTAVWTGAEILIWGGRNGNVFPESGGRYDPSANSWNTLPGGGGRRHSHTAVWTGNEMVVWGGSIGPPVFGGARFSPGTNLWTPLGPAFSPSPRYSHTAVWTGVEMIIWGGFDGASALDRGGHYHPATDSWRRTGNSSEAPPSPRMGHSAVWTGSEMIVWGGERTTTLNDGGRYLPATNSWVAVTALGAPAPRTVHTAVWTGNEMIVWGGRGSASQILFLNSGGRYDPTADIWTVVPPVNLAERFGHSAVWTGREMIVWGGANGTPGAINHLNDGARFNPSTHTWTMTATNGAPSPREQHSAVWTGSEMIVWGGRSYGGDGFQQLPNGSRYNPSLNTWTPVTSVGAPLSISEHTAVWTGNEMIVWGGRGPTLAAVDAGGRYNPTYNLWMPFATADAPIARIEHSAIWTGREMIVWGGQLYGPQQVGPYNTGGRYDAETNSWSPLSLTGAPDARGFHTAVWTGSEMIIWGGGSGPTYFNDTVLYTPARRLFLYRRQ